MEEKILVTYATRLGSSRQTAGFIADVLLESGLQVQLQPIAQATALNNYGAIVMVTALYFGRLHKQAERFLTDHRNELETQRVALFVAGPVDREEKSWNASRAELQARLALHPWFHPIMCQVIGGSWDPASMSPFWKLMLRRVAAKDVRDWDAIRGMVRDLASALKPVCAGPE